MKETFLDTIRKQEKLPPKNKLFEPFFLKAVTKNGYYILGNEALEDYKQEAKGYGLDLLRFLQLNNLTIDKVGGGNWRIKK